MRAFAHVSFFRQADKYLKMLFFTGSIAQRWFLSEKFDGYIDLMKNTVRVASSRCILESLINLRCLIYLHNVKNFFVLFEYNFV